MAWFDGYRCAPPILRAPHSDTLGNRGLGMEATRISALPLMSGAYIVRGKRPIPAKTAGNDVQ
jgi:hypothetical protein